MSRLIAQILLSILLFPLAAVAYIVLFVVFESSSSVTDEQAFVYAGVLVWAFLAVYWWLLWRKSVRWTGARLWLTAGAMLGAVLAGVVVWVLVGMAMETDFDAEFAVFAGSVAAPLLWLLGTVFVWRESAAERGARVIGDGGRNGVVCPTCGYNLTGLKEARCPECGTQFTLDQLLDAQPSRAGVELEK
jgi:hypothetical protein